MIRYSGLFMVAETAATNRRKRIDIALSLFITSNKTINKCNKNDTTVCKVRQDCEETKHYIIQEARC